MMIAAEMCPACNTDSTHLRGLNIMVPSEEGGLVGVSYCAKCMGTFARLKFYGPTKPVEIDKKDFVNGLHYLQNKIMDSIDRSKEEVVVIARSIFDLYDDP